MRRGKYTYTVLSHQTHIDYRKVDTMGQYLMHTGKRGSGGEWSKAAGQGKECICMRMKTRNIKSDTNPE